MHVLGTVNHPDPPPAFDPHRLCVFTFTQSKRPQIYCPSDAGLSIQIILFDPPDPVRMQYMSLQPISLALGSLLTIPQRSSRDFDEIEAEEEADRKRIAGLVEKLKFHSVLRHSPTRQEMALPNILSQVNCSQEIAELLQKNTPLVGPRRKRSMSVSERVVESATTLYDIATWSAWNAFMTYAFPALRFVFQVAVIIHRIVSEGILQVLEWQLPVRLVQTSDQAASLATGPALKDLSACCQQVHLRLQQFSYYPTQYLLLRKRHATWSSIPTTNSDYIRFYNSLWLVANDVIIGIALASFITDNANATSDFLGRLLNQYTIEGLKRTIRWLMSYPGGLKLNTELAAFLGDLFLWVIEYWSTTTVMIIMPHLPKLVYFIGFTSFAGASMPIAIFSDLLSLLTLHIYSFYIASARIFNWQLTIITSLFHLFRGKKRNVLRNRIDNCDYDLDQLLLGTILFTLLFFLLPTVIVFYLTFASARMAIITLKATLDTCLACLNHFPLFALMLRLKDSRRLPGGISFTLLRPEHTRCSPMRHQSDDDVDETTRIEPEITSQVSYISLSSTPLSIRQIFSQYSQLGARIRQHYLSPKVVFRLLTGRFVPPLRREEMYGLQYSVLPRERVSIAEVWKGLTEADSTNIAPLYQKGLGHKDRRSSFSSFGHMHGQGKKY
jgi:phosphatidylinositol N-acetylglucosaminyltransferase subunit Q